MNHAGTWYGEQRWPDDPLEPAWKVSLVLPGEGQVTQWANPRLWLLYRGLSVGPYVLQTALMALEFWLLEKCQLDGFDIETVLLKLLRDSNNVAVTAVVASVCNAHHAKGGRAALGLLSSQNLVEMDRHRIVLDCGSKFSDSLPPHNSEAMICEEERKKSAALPHRREDLEALAVKLQLGREREGVWEVLDRHRAALPPVEEQSDEHRLWRLALHRMDVRGYRPVEPQPDSEARGTEPEGAASEKRLVYYGPGTIEEDVRALVEEDAPVRARQEADLGLLNWGICAWGRDESRGLDITTWQQRLTEAEARDRESPEAEEFTRGGSGFVAAVCVRDHWQEMTSEDREWCVTTLIDEIDRDCESNDSTVQYARNFMQPDRAAAYVLPLVLRQTPPETCDPRLRRALANALTHSVLEVIAYAAEGIGHYLRGDWQHFAVRCVSALAKQATLIAERQKAEEAKPHVEQLRDRDLVRSVISDVRAVIERGDIDAEAELTNLNLDGWPGQEAARTIMQILAYPPYESLALAFHRRVLEFLVASWEATATLRGRRSGARNYQFEYDACKRVAGVVLKLRDSDALTICEPILDALDKHPREVARFIESLVIAEDSSEGETPFWKIWQACADRLCVASWVESLDSSSIRTESLNKIFLALSWKEDIHHWRRLEGQAGRIDALVRRLPVSATALSAYCRFLYAIGERSLPNGFVIVAERLCAGNIREMLAADSVVFYLESLLRKYVYGEPLRLKENPGVRSAALRILDELVESGSSAAFRMRDDFVTPVGNRS